MVIPKYAHTDPKVRELTHNRKFRQAPPHTINRDRILQAIFKGFGTPRKFALSGIQSAEGKAFIKK